MKAIVQDRYGSPEVLELREIDRPVNGDDDVLVRVQAAGVDQGVWHEVAGLPYLFRVAGIGGRAGQRVLLRGGGGGVGASAAHHARAAGGGVPGACTPAKTGRGRSRGPAPVIDSPREDSPDGRNRHDIILDIAGNRSLSHLRR